MKIQQLIFLMTSFKGENPGQIIGQKYIGDYENMGGKVCKFMFYTRITSLPIRPHNELYYTGSTHLQHNFICGIEYQASGQIQLSPSVFLPVDAM